MALLRRWAILGKSKAIQKVFGDHAYKMNISSTKSMTGHFLGAAGAIESIACLMAINHSIIPPTINHFTDDVGLDPKLNLTFNGSRARSQHCAVQHFRLWWPQFFDHFQKVYFLISFRQPESLIR